MSSTQPTASHREFLAVEYEDAYLSQLFEIERILYYLTRETPDIESALRVVRTLLREKPAC